MKLKLFTAALALGLAASASADTTTVAYDEETQTVTTVATVTSSTSTVTASYAGVLSSASSATNWPETTVTFTLDLESLQSYVNSGESGTLTLVSITTSAGTTVGVGMASDGTFVLLNGSNKWYTTSTTLNDLVSSGLTTLAVETGYAASGTGLSGTTASNKPYTWLAATDAGGSSVTTISNIVGLGSTGTSAYVSSVTVNSNYVTAFSVTNAPLSLDSDGVGAASAALAAAVPEPATATLGLLALGALALRRRRA